MTTNIKISITLEGEDNWFEWIESAETVSRKSDIWEYINPELPEDQLLKL